MSIFTAYIKVLNKNLINTDIDPMQYLSNKSPGVAISVVICVCVELLCATRVKVCDWLV